MISYRSIKYKDGSLEWNNYSKLYDAYKALVPLNENVCCRMLINGVRNVILQGETVIRISCSKENVYWIQVIESMNAPLPPINSLRPTCIHHD